jgi:transcription-repair coupling factor (superfamily II helicase)
VEGAALIPDEYVADEAQKLHLYRRLSQADDVNLVEGLRRELRDRYGPIPYEVETLLATASLRILGRELGVERILAREWDARVNFRRGVVPRMVALQRAFAEWQLDVELQRPMPLSLVLHRRSPEPLATALIGALQSLTREKSIAA